MIWAVSLSTEDLCTQGLTSARRIRRFRGRGGNLTSLAQPKSDSTPAFVWWGPLPVLSQVRCSTDIDFVENQLSPGSISFSLLATAHPVLLQQQWVRPGRSGPTDRWFPGGAVHLTEWVPRVSQRLSRSGSSGILPVLGTGDAAALRSSMAAAAEAPHSFRRKPSGRSPVGHGERRRRPRPVSTRVSGTMCLAMARSPGFGSEALNWGVGYRRLPFLRLSWEGTKSCSSDAQCLNSRAHYAKGTYSSLASAPDRVRGRPGFRRNCLSLPISASVSLRRFAAEGLSAFPSRY